MVSNGRNFHCVARFGSRKEGKGGGRFHDTAHLFVRRKGAEWAVGVCWTCRRWIGLASAATLNFRPCNCLRKKIMERKKLYEMAMLT